MSGNGNGMIRDLRYNQEPDGYNNHPDPTPGFRFQGRASLPIMSNDIIRPKPRRLTDVRRSAGIGPDHERILTEECSNQFGQGHHLRSSPPLLPSKPNSNHLILKPHPSIMTPPTQTGSNYPRGQYSHSQSQQGLPPTYYNNGPQVQPQFVRQAHPVPPFYSSAGGDYVGPSSPPGQTQRSVRNIQDEELYLTPISHINKRMPINSQQEDYVPYYAELIPDPPQGQGDNKLIQPSSAPVPAYPRGVRVEWKSVDNLPKSSMMTPKLVDFREEYPVDVHPRPGLVKSLHKSFELLSSPNNYAMIEGENPYEEGDSSYDKIRGEKAGDSTGPEYDQIQMPSPDVAIKNAINEMRPSLAVLDKDRGRGVLKGCSNVYSPPPNSGLKATRIIKDLQENSIEKESTETSPGNPDGHWNNNIVHEQRPSSGGLAGSKLKSRRRNILQQISAAEDMILLNPQEGLNGTNTGTGGSSSSGTSSGHASMSDSQTSGSPPTTTEYPRLNETVSVLNHHQSQGHSIPFKSVLKSVPEDEANQSPPGVGAQSLDQGGKGLSPASTGKKSSSRSRRKNKDPLVLGSGNSGLEDIKQAIEQLTLRSYNDGSGATNDHHQVLSERSRHGGGGGRTDHHSSYSTSTYSSMSGSECDRHVRRRNALRHSSMETINTQVTSADEFVWVDSHNRLVELQSYPWTNHDILKVIEKSTKLKDSLERISMETVPRVSYLLQRALVRVAREAQRLSKPFGFCTKQEIASAFRIVLSPSLADSCIKACLRASAMFSVSTGDPLHRESKSSRAGLNLHVGRFQRWMTELRLGRVVHEFAAIHLTAGFENLIEEILGSALVFLNLQVNPEQNPKGNNGSGQPVLTAVYLEKATAQNADLWGLLQPFAHLSAGRMASGALALPRWASVASVNSSGSSSTTIAANQESDSLGHTRLYPHQKSLEQSLLTTCVGSVSELSEIIARISHYQYKQIPVTPNPGSGGKSVTVINWSPMALQSLFYFMRCSQLESADESLNLASSTATLGSSSTVGDREKSQDGHGRDGASKGSSSVPLQELVYERPFIVLPPLIEWVKVACAHTEHRHSILVDQDDVMQAARLLLPGIDCPPRVFGCDEFVWPKRVIDEFECNIRVKIDLGFKMLVSGRADLVTPALLLMPPSKANTFNETGFTPLILASIRGDEHVVKILLDSGADPNLETPANGPNYPRASNETQHWTALTFASLMGHLPVVKILLERGGINVEGGAKVSEDKSTQTPLQCAVATGNLDIVSLLLNYGANPFMCTLVRDSLCYMGSASRGSFSAISVAAAHGQRNILQRLLSNPLNPSNSSREVLSLEEILAEGIPSPAPKPPRTRAFQSSHHPRGPTDGVKSLSKTQLRALQEAMYQSAESGHLEITLDLRNMGVPWTLHCWINTLASAHDLRCDGVIEQLLQDFLYILPNEDFSQTQFVDECLPLLFGIFRNTKNENTITLLASIFQTCYGKDVIKKIRDITISNGTRIDPKYVNNPELSDVQFRLEGRIFYAHKIVLVTSSPRFKSMLKGASTTSDATPPVLHLTDVRYHIFQMVMEYLYNGGCETIKHLENEDVLELMAAANYFQLDGLLRFCEAKCSQVVNPDSVVALYIHAKVYNAVQLLEYCQGYLLQNMVAILTTDESARRLVFGKKLQNHDVLAGLLLTLQARLKSKPTTSSIIPPNNHLTGQSNRKQN